MLAAFVVVVIRMFVTPSPVGSLILHFYFSVRPVRAVPFVEVQAMRTVFVVIPVVVVVMIMVIDADLEFLRRVRGRACRAHRYWRGECCR